MSSRIGRWSEIVEVRTEDLDMGGSSREVSRRVDWLLKRVGSQEIGE